MKAACAYVSLLLTGLTFGTTAEEIGVRISSSSPASVTLSESLRYEVDAAIARAVDWLASQQHEDGSWSDRDTPALTGLALWACTRSSHPDASRISDKAVHFLLSCRQSDGGIYARKGNAPGGGLAAYNTAICMTALFSTERDDLTQTILRARDFVSKAQHFGSDDYHGGFAYDTRSGNSYANLLSAFHSAQAMHDTSVTETQRVDGKRVDIDWAGTVQFIERLNTTTNAVLPDGQTQANAAVPLRSYGSMTYAGLLALIYAKVSPQDVRVRSALDWSTKHWSLDENPGMGREGLYFFYNVLARALDATDVDVITREDGTDLNWRENLAQKLVSLQKTDTLGQGYWQNDDARFWENNPVLATSYCLLALQRL